PLGGGATTTWVKECGTVLAANVASPSYAATIVCVPAASVAVEKVAWSWPPTIRSGTGRWATPSIVKVTLPVGVPDPLVGATVAVNVTIAPTAEGLADETTVVAVDRGL